MSKNTVHKDTKGLNNANWHRRELSLQALLLFAEQVSGYDGKALGNIWTQPPFNRVFLYRKNLPSLQLSNNMHTLKLGEPISSNTHNE